VISLVRRLRATTTRQIRQLAEEIQAAPERSGAVLRLGCCALSNVKWKRPNQARLRRLKPKEALRCMISR